MSRNKKEDYKYLVITPARNESAYIQHTIDSMIQQTVLPVRWIVVDDGSSDSTGDIVRRYAGQHSWIEYVRCEQQEAESGNPLKDHVSHASRAMRARRAKEIEAFYVGFEHAASIDWNYIVKLDGDVSFSSDYFRRCFAEFDKDPALGMGGGNICHNINGELRPEENPRFHVRGATKIYRRRCWEAIGGVVRGAGWDTLDEVRANLNGWRTTTFEQLTVVHHRVTGAANGCWQNAVKNGLWNYVCGYHPLFMLAKCAKRLFQPPYLIESCGLLCGFLLGYLKRVPRNADDHLISFLRQQQLRRISGRSTIWQ